jgi:hypothetical protein
MFGFSPFATTAFAALPAGGVLVTGVYATGSVGTVLVTFPVNVSLTGIKATATAGSVLISGKATVTVTGVQASGGMSNVLVWGIIDDSQTPNWIEIPT